jgi:hypothetical protein
MSSFCLLVGLTPASSGCDTAGGGFTLGRLGENLFRGMKLHMWSINTKPGSRMCEISYYIYLNAIVCGAIAILTSIAVPRGISGKKRCMCSICLPYLPYLSCLQRENGASPSKNSINQNEFPPENCHFGGSWKASGRLCSALRSRYVALTRHIRMTGINSSGKALWPFYNCASYPVVAARNKEYMINVIDFQPGPETEFTR